MIMDDKLVFSEEQAITATAVGANVIDTGVADSMIGDGAPVYLNCVVDTAFTGQGTTTLQVAVQDSADDSAYDDVVISNAVDEADLVAGKCVLKVALPNGLRRYIRLNYTVGSGPFTAGKVNAFLSMAAEQDL
jgi:hypothetical protein